MGRLARLCGHLGAVLAVALLLLLAGDRPADAADFTVNTSDDSDDPTPDGACNDGAGNCSLREAIQEANATAGPDVIAFNIPGAGPHTIQPSTELPVIQSGITIDGYTEPGASNNTAPPWSAGNASLMIELDGSNAGSAAGLNIIGTSVVVRGLAINSFDSSGVLIQGSASALVEGNYIGTDVSGAVDKGNGSSGVSILPGNTQAGIVIGGTDAGDRNLISGNQGNGVILAGGANAAVRGNLIGTNAAGDAALPNANFGVRANIGAPVIGGAAAGAGNLISGNDLTGVAIDSAADSTQVLGNRIGSNAAGTAPLLSPPSGVSGVLVSGASQVVIGGPAPGAGNVISGNPQVGIYIAGSADLLQVKGNLIGTQPDGVTPLPNNNYSVLLVSGAHDNTIGGENITEQNTIAYNDSAGVRLASDAGVNNYIGPNIIHSNVGLGIDLPPFGGNPNDQDDPDTGPNDLQNYPVLTSAVNTGSTTIIGTLNSTPNHSFNLLFFANTACDPSGYGEGRTYLGMAVVNTDANGDAAFSEMFAAQVPLGQFITSTASDPKSTSEFSQCLPVTGTGGTPTLTPTSTVQPTATPTPTPTPVGQTPTPGVQLAWGNVDCKDVGPDSVDALQDLRFVAKLGVNQAAGCPGINTVVEVVGASPHKWGDVNCDGGADSLDALRILRYVAKLPDAPVAGCPVIGTLYEVR